MLLACLYQHAFNIFSIAWVADIPNLQLRYHGSLKIVWMSTPVVLWYAGGNTCASYTVVWLGCIPILVCFACLTGVQLRLMQPRIPLDGPPEPHTVLQQFAWTAAGLTRARVRRSVALTQDSVTVAPSALNAPMFCFETAIKTFYWSAALYELEAEAADGHCFSAPALRHVRGVAEALALFGLTEWRVFHDAAKEVKVVVAWGAQWVLVCARGSIKKANFIADLQVHHP
jgi:hypothetical protein